MKRLMMRMLMLMVTFFALAAIVGGCAVMNCIECSGWREVYDYFSDENGKANNYNFKAVVDEVTHYEGIYESLVLDLTVDAEDFKSKYESDEKFSDGSLKWETDLKYFDANLFEIIGDNLRVLQNNGACDLLVEGTEIIITTNSYYGWDGWCYPVLELKINDTVYLDYETGLQNFLEYALMQFEN